MSTLSEDLDYFDRSIFDPLAKIAGQSSGVSLGSKGTEDSGEEEEEELAGMEDAEGEGEEPPEPGERATTPESFASSLWSEKEPSVARTPDSWDVPVGAVPWDDNDRPFEKLLTYADLTLTEEEEGGLLTDRIVAACGSYLTESPGNKCHALAKVLLDNKNLNNIRILGAHRFLQYVDLSWNNLTDLTPLGCLPYLMYLDVSHNLLEKVLRFNPPLNLTYVNYSYNEVWQMSDLTDFWALCYLDLSHNKISKIQGLHNLRYLRYLDMSHNKIERFENLSNLRITDLNLEYNLIFKFEMEEGCGMHTMPNLTNVYLNNNLIKSLEFLKQVYSLKKLELQGNNVADLVELNHMKLLKHLRHLDMSGNPVSELKPYRSLVLNFLQDLKFLDQTEVDISERVAACKSNRFDVQLEAARIQARLTLLDQLNDTSLDLDVLPVDQGPYPFVVLVGPSASSKKHIIDSLGRKHPDKIYVGRLHTTRNILNAEKNVLVHVDREEFTESIKAGKFLCVTESLGHLYGFSREELATAVKERKLCLTAMDMVAALTLHGYGLQPFLVLAIPHSSSDHEDRLRKTYGPVLSKLGAAYMAQRQLIDTHESNIKRIETILLDIVDKVLQDALPSDCYSDEPKSTFEGKSSSGATSNSEPEETPSDSEKNAVRYPTSGGCFKCLPSRCGYQASKLSETPDRCLSLHSTDSQRLSASESDMRGETTLTSYSASGPVPIKVDVSSYGGSSFGEEDLFLNWSTPFIDWSEVNLNALQLEEAAEILCSRYIESVMSTRDVYKNLHLENPGLFSLAVFTDDEEKALRDITQFLKDVWRSTPNRKPPFDLQKDLIYQTLVPKKLEKLKAMLRADFLSADGDGAFVGIDDSRPANSPVAICGEMRSRGYGDAVE